MAFDENTCHRFLWMKHAAAVVKRRYSSADVEKALTQAQQTDDLGERYQVILKKENILHLLWLATACRSVFCYYFPWAPDGTFPVSLELNARCVHFSGIPQCLLWLIVNNWRFVPASCVRERLRNPILH